jgi:hypothetical protein
VKNGIAFIIIGAQKSGTTALFKFLAAHPEVYLPPEKELNYFAINNNYADHMARYFTYFSHAKPNQHLGEASTYYMMYDCVPQRIQEIFPHVKIIALLRHPVERAYSHYLMARRRGLEPRPFDEAVRQLIKRGRVADDHVDPERDYVQFGEYGRILTEYLYWFPQQQLKIIFHDHLRHDPENVMQNLFRFLGVDAGFCSPVFRQTFHQSGRRRLPSFVRNLLSQAIARSARVVGTQRARTWQFWLETQLDVLPVKDAGMSAEARSLLTSHYAADVAILEQLSAEKMPWAEFARRK